jgi:hypothetical protein
MVARRSDSRDWGTAARCDDKRRPGTLPPVAATQAPRPAAARPRRSEAEFLRFVANTSTALPENRASSPA